VPATSRSTIPDPVAEDRHGGARARERERGGILLAALVITALAATLLIGAAYDATMRLRMRDKVQDGAMALVCAQAGLENAQRMASTDTTLTMTDLAPLWINNKPVGRGAVSVTALDPGDGMIAPSGASLSSTADTVRLSAAGQVTRTLTAEYVRLPHGAMKQAVYSRTTIGLDGITVEGRLRAHGAVTLLTTADIYGDITTLTGQTITAALDDGNTDLHYVADTLGMPAVDLDWFHDAGQRITLPMTRTLSNKVYGPSVNPSGPASPDGIYWIDAAGGDVYLQNVAVIGTLAVLNANTVYIGTALGATTNYYHEPADPVRMPALLVEGNLSMYIEGNTFSFTLSGTPYNLPCGIKGVIYCTGVLWGPQVNASHKATFTGSIIAHEVHLRGPATLIRHDEDFNLDPIAGLTLSGLRLVPGTRREM
jgi:hypothetical protein